MTMISQRLREILGNTPMQCFWAKAKNVRFDDLFMDAALEIDGGDVFDVLLGLGNVTIKPKDGSRCLLLRIEEAEAFVVIYCEQIDEMRFNGDGSGGIGLTEKIAERLKRVEDEVESMKSTFNAHVHSGVTTGAGSSGPPPSPMIAALQPRTDQDYISSTIIKHG